ncbi:MAG: CoA transferase, partial [Ilumatobacteraceae bacterium]
DDQRDALAAIVGALYEDAISTWTSGRTIDEVERTLQAAGVPVHGVQNSAAWGGHAHQPHPHHNPTRDPPRPHTCIVAGPRGVGSRTPGVVRRAGPSIGEHNDDVLREILGYDDDHITDLVIAGALG